MTYIVLEGIDGSGTTTQVRKLRERLILETGGVRWVQTVCEPSQSPSGKLVREFFEGRHGDLPNWRTMLHLFQADREALMHEVINPFLLVDENIIISDRCWMSTLVYQQISARQEAVDAGGDGEKAQQEAVSLIQRINARGDHIAYPDLTLILDVSLKTAEERKAGRGSVSEGDHYESKKRFVKAVAEKYAAVAGPNIVRIDANGTECEVADAVFSAVSAIL